ncbi:hypothetical protein D3C87_1572410 [compost metagenome]
MLKLLDGFLSVFHLARRIGFVERRAFHNFWHQGLGLFHHFLTRRHRQIQLLGDFRQVLVGGGAVVDHDDGVILDLFGFRFLMRQTTGFDFGHTFGRGIVDEFGGCLGEGTVGNQAQ